MSGGIDAAGDGLLVLPAKTGDGPDAIPACRAWPAVGLLPLTARDSAPARARGYVGNVLREWGLGHLADDAAALVSELVTNGVRASGGGDPLRLRLLADCDQVIFEVWDGAPGLPRLRPPDVESPGGRGLSVVQGIARRWGCRRVTADLKVVWCELPTGQAHGG
jgi:anti-sigma regulatory factor (Ser/Thr protein kinase)